MPLTPSRQLIGTARNALANRRLGVILALIAGAINAGGFLAVQQYTSHMTGMVSAMADAVALGQWLVVGASAGALVAFVAGAAVTAVLVNLGRRQGWHSQYALPLLLEAALLLVFGLLGPRLASMHGLFVPLTVMLLCFMMGLQNALITKMSRAEIRTTHLTGVMTDLGIELGKALYWNRDGRDGLEPVRVQSARVRLLLALSLAFFLGGVLGALGFQAMGYAATLPIAGLLLLLSLGPLWDDVRRRGQGQPA